MLLFGLYKAPCQVNKLHTMYETILKHCVQLESNCLASFLCILCLFYSPVKDAIVTNDRWCDNGCKCHHGGTFTYTDRYNPGIGKTAPKLYPYENSTYFISIFSQFYMLFFRYQFPIFSLFFKTMPCYFKAISPYFKPVILKQKIGGK